MRILLVIALLCFDQNCFCFVSFYLLRVCVLALFFFYEEEVCTELILVIMVMELELELKVRWLTSGMFIGS